MEMTHRQAVDNEVAELCGFGYALVRVAPSLKFQLDAATGKLERACRRARLAYHAELHCEQFAQSLRRCWLQYSAIGPSRVYRSPTSAQQARLDAMPLSDEFGYERDISPLSLEQRCAGFFPPAPPNWRVTHLLFSSGQAAMTSALLSLQGAWGRARIGVRHLGAYFETRALLDAQPAYIETLDDGDPRAADCLIIEPVACDGNFRCVDIKAVAAHYSTGAPRPRAAIFDTTLLGLTDAVQAFLLELGPEAHPLVLNVSSGLKLFQAGLELANVGVLSLFERKRSEAGVTIEGLRRLRTLTGGGLRFSDAIALQAPWVFDAATAGAHEDAVFANNAALAHALHGDAGLFEPVSHPSFHGANAPYCAFRLRHASVHAYQQLDAGIMREARRRRVLIDRGGSFGFRGHRFEVVEPETNEAPFLRIAMGRRQGWSSDGVIALMRDLARTTRLPG